MRLSHINLEQHEYMISVFFFFFEGNVDYMEISEPLMFDPSDVPRRCTITVIISENFLENAEFFTVSLSSPLQESALNFSDPTTTVTITDTTGMDWLQVYNRIVVNLIISTYLMLTIYSCHFHFGETRILCQ